jgi:integrase
MSKGPNSFGADAPLPKGFAWYKNQVYAVVKHQQQLHRQRVRAPDAASAHAQRAKFEDDLKRAIAQHNAAQAKAAKKQPLTPIQGSISIEAGGLVGGGDLTWPEAVELYDRHARGVLGEDTLKRYWVSFRMVDPYVRHLRLSQITRTVLLDLICERLKESTTATVNRDLTAISQVLEYAQLHEWVEVNVAALIPRRKITKEKRDPIHPPSEEDVLVVYERLPGNFANLMRFAAETGCRQEGAVTLTWDRVNLSAKLATVVEKGNKARTINLHDDTAAWMAKLERSADTKLVFWHPDGKGRGVGYRNVSSRFRLLVREVAHTQAQAQRPFRVFRFHDLRHRYGTRMLEMGADLYGVSRHLGHESVKTTEGYLKMVSPAARQFALSGTSQVRVQTLPLHLPLEPKQASKAGDEC